MDTKLIKQKILDLAIRGKLVPQNPADEPASVLLERIKAEKAQLIKEGKIKKEKAVELLEEPPFRIPDNWQWCTLRDLAFYKKGPFGSSLTKSMFVPDTPEAYKVYEQKNAIQKNEALGNYFIDKEKFEELKSFEVFPNDIIVSCAGTIGETYVLPKGSRPGIINQALMVIRLYYRDIEPFYLLYFDYMLKAQAASEGKGTAIKNIPPFDVLKNYYIPLPPLEEQKRIVAEIDRWFKCIDELEKNQQDLHTAIQQAKSKILDLAIHGKLVPQDSNDEQAAVLLERIKAEKAQLIKEGKIKKVMSIESIEDFPFIIPRNWIWTYIDTLAIDMADGPFGSNLKAEHYTDKKEVRIIQLSNIGEEGWKETNTKYTTFDHLKTIQRSEVYPGNLVIAKMMPAGRAIICPDHEKGYVLSSDAVKLCPSNYIYNRWLLYTINSPEFKKQVYENVQGVTRVRTSIVKLKQCIVPLPPETEQKRIVSKIEELFTQLDKIEESLN